MQVATITFHGAHNYGAMLQAYALRRYVDTQGHSCRIIDIRTPESLLNYALFKPNRHPKTVLKNLATLVHYRALKEGWDRFEQFMADEYLLTKRYASFEELQADPPVADLYITGSDQVWNVSKVIRPEFFLQFGLPSVKRVAYAASIGVSQIPEENKASMLHALRAFDAISVRERQARQLLLDLGEVQSEVVLDPVFLLSREQWQEVAVAPNLATPYIFCYSLYNPPSLNLGLKKLRAQTGLPIVLVTNESITTVDHDIIVRNAGPREFLGLLQHAAWVVTSSFHGTALAILLQKNFYTVVNKLVGSRIDTILETTGLSSRILENDARNCDAKNLISYQEVDTRLTPAINASQSFLHAQLTQ